MNYTYLTTIFETESHAISEMLRLHPKLRPFFQLDLHDSCIDLYQHNYVKLLKIKADYVQFTVPALRAAGTALQDGDAEDRAWSDMFLGYAAGETDEAENYGHHIWALDDLRAIDPISALINAPISEPARLYGQYFVDAAPRHPYAILGAKGVLEHLSIKIADDLVRGVHASGIPNAFQGTKFFHHHGVLDIDHVQEGDRNLSKLTSGRKLQEILEGAYFTSGSYRALIDQCL